MKSVRIGVIQSEHEEIQTRITPNTDTFYVMYLYLQEFCVSHENCYFQNCIYFIYIKLLFEYQILKANVHVDPMRHVPSSIFCEIYSTQHCQPLNSREIVKPCEKLCKFFLETQLSLYSYCWTAAWLILGYQDCCLIQG